MDTNKSLMIGASLLLLFLSCQPQVSAAKQSEAQPATDEQLVQRLKAAKIVESTADISATTGSDEILVNTQRDPKLDDAKLKLQAVLIAKIVLDLAPSSIQRAKIVYTNPDGQGTSKILVNRPEIKMYGTGQLSEKALLDSLAIEQDQVRTRQRRRNDFADWKRKTGCRNFLEASIWFGTRIKWLADNGVNVDAERQALKTWNDTVKVYRRNNSPENFAPAHDDGLKLYERLMDLTRTVYARH